jgi:hypothetical protein
VQVAWRRIALTVRVGMPMLAVVNMRMGVRGAVRVHMLMDVRSSQVVVMLRHVSVGVPNDRPIREDMLVHVVVGMGVFAPVDMGMAVHRAVRVVMFVLVGCLAFDARLTHSAATGRTHVGVPLLTNAILDANHRVDLDPYQPSRPLPYSTSISFTRISVPPVT